MTSTACFRRMMPHPAIGLPRRIVASYIPLFPAPSFKKHNTLQPRSLDDSVRSMSANSKTYQYLVRKPKSVYKQLFIKDRWIAARTLYGMYAREESPMTPEEIAADYDLPLESVREAIAYCESNPPELKEDHAREEAVMEATGMSAPGYDGQPKVLTPQEMSRLRRL